MGHFNFVSTWKAVAIVITGGFGVLGLLKDFRDKHTKRITRWGRISLIGIVISSCLGVAAQLRESSEQDKIRQQTAQQTLALAQKADTSLSQIRRLLAPLVNARFFMEFDFDCTRPTAPFKNLCDAIRQDGYTTFHFGHQVQVRASRMPTNKYWPYWPGGEKEAGLELRVLVFRNSKNADEYVNGGWRKHFSSGSESADLILRISAVPFNGNGKLWFVKDDFNKTQYLELDRFDLDQYGVKEGNGNVVSMVDFAGCTVIIESAGSNPEWLEMFKPRFIDISIAGHGELTIEPFRRISGVGPIFYRSAVAGASEGSVQ